MAAALEVQVTRAKRHKASAPIEVGTARARLLATLDATRELVAELPEPACLLLEQSGVLQLLRSKAATVRSVASAAVPVVDAVRAVSAAVASFRSR